MDEVTGDFSPVARREVPQSNDDAGLDTWYYGPNLTPEQLREYAFSVSDREDPLREFAEACRKELARLDW